MSEDQSLAMIDAVRVALEKATSMQEVKGVLNMASAAETYARQAKLGQEIELSMREYICRAECKLGELLEAGKAAGQIGRGGAFNKANVDGDDIHKTTLADAGISRDLSARAQKLAAIPKADFERLIAAQKENGTISVKKMIAAATDKFSKPPRERPKTGMVIKLSESGVPLKEISETTGVGPRIVDGIIREEKIRRSVQPEITPEMLSLSAREKLDRAIAGQLKKLAAKYQIDVETEVTRRVKHYLESTAKRWQEIYEESKRIRDRRDGLMTARVYRSIAACLQGDWLAVALKDDPIKQKRYQDAFIEFTKLEPYLLSEKERPTIYPPLPKNWAEWQELRRKVTQDRKAARVAKGSIVKK